MSDTRIYRIATLNAAPERDPFPTVRCRSCGRSTTSVSGEEDCATCDLRWLLRGVDWQAPLRRELGRQAFFDEPQLGWRRAGEP